MATVSPEVFTAFADFFADPLERGDIAALRELGRLGGLAPLADHPGASAAWRRARDILAFYADTEEAVSELNAAFCCLLLGAGGPHGNAPPYESAYSGAFRLFGEPTAEMDALLTHHGLNVAGSEPADHLSIELALLVVLLDGPAADAPAAAAMLERLAGWVPRFAARCRECDASGFYAALAEMLQACLPGQWAAAPTPSESRPRRTLDDE